MDRRAEVIRLIAGMAARFRGAAGTTAAVIQARQVRMPRVVAVRLVEVLLRRRVVGVVVRLAVAVRLVTGK